MRLALTAVAAAVLAALAGAGVYTAAQSTTQQVQSPVVNYGARP